MWPRRSIRKLVEMPWSRLLGEQTVRVEDHAKARDMVRKEPLGVGKSVIYVDRDADKTVRTRLALHPCGFSAPLTRQFGGQFVSSPSPLPHRG
jgi:hypothetical protein